MPRRHIELTDKTFVMQFVSITPHVMPDGQLGECWEWQRSRDRDGYGRVNRDYAHRAVYESLVGKIPDGLELDHLCRNRPCVNPEHLEPVTGKINTLRGESFSGINSRKQFCSSGHPFSEANTYIDAQGWRHCRKCNAVASERKRAKKRATKKTLEVKNMCANGAA